MKVCICDTVIDTKKINSAQELDETLQKRYDDWLGKDKITIHVTKISYKRIEFLVERKYGSWYEDPKRFSSCDGHAILDLDGMIITGEGYQTGTVADFSTHPGRYIINYDIKTFFLPDYKKLQKQRHLSRIKKIEYDEFLDHFTFAIEAI